MEMAGSRFPSQAKNLSVFTEWLQAREDFLFVIDGANVAYHRQNFSEGQFSYRQIEIVYDKLISMGARVLVLVPESYCNRGNLLSGTRTTGNRLLRLIPNRSKNCSLSVTRHRKSILTAEDEVIIDKFERADHLYRVPQGGNDDWYWLYSTVCEGRTSDSPAFVVTNDLMRDHRLAAFLEPRTFLRWTTSQIIRLADLACFVYDYIIKVLSSQNP